MSSIATSIKTRLRVILHVPLRPCAPCLPEGCRAEGSLIYLRVANMAPMGRGRCASRDY
jgi:hypothetical protein